MDRTRAERMVRDLQGKQVGGWTVGRLLGNGASALVLAAEKNGSVAALKVIDPEMVERFGAASQIARLNRERALIGHGQPNLISILDGGRCPDTEFLFLAMELLPSNTHCLLTDAVADLPRAAIAPLIAQLANSARYLLDTLGIVHRDIKPDNIMVTLDCTTATLLDLGVSLPLTALEDAGTGDAFVGTTRYSPPEFISREEEPSLDGWRAVTFYQLGAVLHDMIMRVPLFGDIRAPSARVIDAVRHRNPVIDADDVPAWLVQLARDCLVKDWRLRLQLVNWDSFAGVIPAADALTAKERIRQRMAAVNPNPPPPVVATRPSRKTLGRLGEDLATLIGEVRRRSDVFPPLEVRQRVADGQLELMVSAGPWQQPPLPASLQIRLLCDVLDSSGTIVRIRAAATLCQPGETPALPETKVEVYRGDIALPAAWDRFDAFLHSALDVALGAGPPPSGGIALHLSS
jgi:serine/threonine protein kinase